MDYIATITSIIINLAKIFAMDLFITPLFTIGPFQIVVIVVVALIVFGPVGLGKKLGNLVKGTGQGVKEFKKALEEGKEDEEKTED